MASTSRHDHILRRLGSAFAALVLVGVFLVAVAHAAGLGGVSSADLGASSATVSSCDSDGFTYDLTISTGLVTAVVVGDITDPDCEGGTLELTLVDDTGTGIGSGTATVAVDDDTDDNVVTVSLSVQPLLSNVDGIHAAITGP